MLVNELFLKAKKDKGLRSLIVASRDYDGKHRTYMYLSIEEQSKYSNKVEAVFVESDTEIRIDNYSGWGDFSKNREVNTICFHCDTRSTSGEGHVMTFLNAIKKDSEVRFKVVAYSGSDYLREKQLVHHQLYGYIGEKCYFLSDYVGEGNLVAPVQ